MSSEVYLGEVDCRHIEALTYAIEQLTAALAESTNSSYNSVRDAIAPDCMHCRVHGHCSVSKGSDCCKHLFWCNRHP